MTKFIKENLFNFILIICVTTITVGWFYFPETAEARSGCCSWHGGVCGCSCCDGTPLSAKCAPYYPWCSRSYTPSYPAYTAPSIPSCPSNSYYDSISKSCKCNYGYVVEKDFLGKESCISGNSYCSDKYGYNSNYNSLNKTCQCNYGYIMNGGKCISENEYCKNLYGYNAKYNILTDSCECVSGYVLDKDLFNDVKCIDGDVYCRDKYGYYSSYKSFSKKCECDYGYELVNGKCKKKQEISYTNNIYTPDLLNLSDNNKICGNNSYLTSDDKCTCKLGYIWVDVNDSKNLDCEKKIILPSITSIQNNAPHVQNSVIDTVVEREKKLFSKSDNNLIKRLEGKILLQVEENGEGWYIYPNDKKKYYLGQPADAFSVMRKLGLGATHEFITSHTIFPDHVLGKILLDVEQNGEAYYIYPKDKKAYYLGRPADAFSVMRKLGLGITNNDVRKIDVGEIK
ncbi:hypothetical protein KAR28_02665 [Candidatus Parcubacteria bacterium]|nr:hypothetical protein [Candidatus Parcubacteria bacterium]